MQIIKHGYDYKKFQIMAPMYRGTNGIDNLNKQLQEVFNPRSIDKEEIKYGDVYYRENDKVLQLVNMPDDNVFNGDIGVIDRIVKANISKSGKNEIYIDFDGNIVKYETKDLIKIKHGYVITIHKSQGSEFDVVVMPITHEYYRMLYRKLVYTGVTRAKKKLIIIGEGDSFIRAVMNNNEYVRKTDLKNKLIEKITS
jgi:exodeoxyribonuclease V alpha subunit